MGSEYELSQISEHLITFGEKYPIPELIDFIGDRTDRSRKDVAYIHPLDRNVMKKLSNLPMQQMINTLINTYTDYLFYELRSNSILLTKLNYPDLFQTVTHASSVLQLPWPQVYVRDAETIAAYTAGTDEACLIVITTGLIHFLTKPELAFVIGHECGHIHSRHILFNNFVKLLSKGADNISCNLPPAAMFMMPLRHMLAKFLKEWTLAAELTADRAGLIICRDLQAATEALKKIDRTNNFTAVGSGFSTLVTKRIEELQVFWSSKAYHLIEQTGRV